LQTFPTGSTLPSSTYASSPDVARSTAAGDHEERRVKAVGAAIIALVAGGVMIALGREWAEDPANIGGAFVLVRVAPTALLTAPATHAGRNGQHPDRQVRSHRTVRSS